MDGTGYIEGNAFETLETAQHGDMGIEDPDAALDALLNGGQPAGQPEGQPAGQPEGQPAGQPEGQPAGQPEGQPEGQPAGQPAGAISVTIDGAAMNFSSPEEMAEVLANKSFSVSVQQDESAAVQLGLDDNDLLLMAELKAGNLGALEKITDTSKIEDWMDTESTYVPTKSLKQTTPEEFELNRIKGNTEVYNAMTSAPAAMGEHLSQEVFSSTDGIQLVEQQIKARVFDTIISETRKASLKTGENIVDAYKRVSLEHARKQTPGGAKSAGSANGGKTPPTDTSFNLGKDQDETDKNIDAYFKKKYGI